MHSIYGCGSCSRFLLLSISSTKIIENNGVKELAKNGDSISFFPSPTNGVFLNETMIYSDESTHLNST